MTKQERLRNTFTYSDGNLLWQHNNGSAKQGAVAGSAASRGYRQVRFDGKAQMQHRLIWEYFNGELEDGLVVDHIDRDVTNNHIDNLRACTQSINLRNVSKRTGSNLVRGVRKRGTKWRTEWLGKFHKSFNSFEDACAERIYLEVAGGYTSHLNSNLA